MSPITQAIFDEPISPDAYKTPTIDTSDSDLVKIDRAWELESSLYHNELETKVWKPNENYYFGKQTDVDMIPTDMSHYVQNQIFMGIETIIPIMTANPPQFVVQPPDENDESVKYANTVQNVLSSLYETMDVRTKGEMLMRHMAIYRFGAWKPYWDYEENNVNIKYVRPKRLYFPKVTTELPYMREKVDITAKEFKDIWGEKKFGEFLKNRGEKGDEEQLMKISGLYTIWEVWTNELLFWRSGNMIIDKRKNPTYDWTHLEKSKDKKEDIGEDVEGDKNYFNYPKIPYIIASMFRLGNEPVGETDLITQTIPIQDVVNVAGRLVINNGTKTGNMQWLVDATVMSEEEARTKLTNAPGLIIYGQGVANPNLMRRDPPPPLPAYIENIKVSAERAFDNIFGTHSTTRGSQEKSETLGGRLLLKQADIGRIDLAVREYERCVALLGNWVVQLMRINFKAKETFKYYGESGLKFINLEPRMIQKGSKIIVKSGTTLPTDELSKRREALELWGMNAIDPVTLFQRLKFPNPEEAAQKLQTWRSGQLAQEAAIKNEGQPEGRSVPPLPSAQAEIGKIGGDISAGKFTKPKI